MAATVLNGKRLIPGRSLAPVFRVLAWSFAALLSGVFPGSTPEVQLCEKRAAMAGKSIAEGRRFALVELRGDWEWFYSLFQFKVYWRSVECCWLCLANTTNYADFSDNAPWLAQGRSHQGFMADVCGDPGPLAAVPGFHMQMLKPCSMHTVNLGLGCDLNGALLVDAITEFPAQFGGGTTAEKLRQAHDLFKLWARANAMPHSQPMFTEASLHISETGYVSHSAKAWNSRVVSAWLSALWTDMSRQHPQDSNTALRASAVFALAAFYQLVEESPRLLSPAQGALALQWMLQCLRAYKVIALRAAQAGRLMYPSP